MAKIPPGVYDGSLLRLKGKGHQFLDKNLKSGDLLIKVNVKKHDHYSFDGKTLVATKSITISQAILGASVSVTLIDGTVH